MQMAFWCLEREEFLLPAPKDCGYYVQIFVFYCFAASENPKRSFHGTFPLNIPLFCLNPEAQTFSLAAAETQLAQSLFMWGLL